jgi:hypothetical protein
VYALGLYFLDLVYLLMILKALISINPPNFIYNEFYLLVSHLKLILDFN